MANAELSRLAARFKQCRAESEAWPMLVYEDVLTTADRWDMLKRGSGYDRFNAWLQTECFGKSWTLGRFKLVRDVIGRIGEHARRTWTWAAAQWAYNTLSDDELRVAHDSYALWMKQNHGHPLSRGMLQRHVREMRAGKKAE